MLIRFKNNQEKIAMGLLSFMPKERDVKNLQETMKAYTNDENCHLYLLKEANDFIGAIGVKVTDDTVATIEHISVNPSFRNKGYARKMIKQVCLMYKKDYKICSNKYTDELINKCVDDDYLDKLIETRP